MVPNSKRRKIGCSVGSDNNPQIIQPSEPVSLVSSNASSHSDSNHQSIRSGPRSTPGEVDPPYIPKNAGNLTPDSLSSIQSTSTSSTRPRLTSYDSSNSIFQHGYQGLSRSTGEVLTLDGYKDVKVITVHYDDVVACHAFSTTRGDQKVYIKLSLSAKPNVSSQFKAESQVLSMLHENGIHNVTKIIAREVGRLGSMMIIQDEAIVPLWDTYVLNRKFTPAWTDSSHLLRALDHSIKMVRIVGSIHDLGIVHGSLRLGTISTSVFNEVHIHDFSCCFRDGPEGRQPPIRERGMKEQGLPYLAPECAGRSGKSADYRSDYYSMGASLYEMFAGCLPFPEASDPLEIIHSHITRKVPPANSIDPSIPEPLSQVIAKLLEKAPEKRYQTWQGLVIDLEAIARIVRESFATNNMTLRLQGKADPEVAASNGNTQVQQDFIVGSVDEAAYFRLPPPQKMYGREDAVERLLKEYQDLEKNGKQKIVVVKGSSGIGKTCLVEKVRKPVLEARGFYTSIKFDQIKSPVPFFATCQALAGLFRQLLSESEPELIKWRRRLRGVFGKEGRVIAEVAPTVENIFEPGWLDSLPAVVSLAPAESEARFQSLVQEVLRTFSRPKRPLVIVFDDLQWSSPSDIDFILSLSKPSDQSKQEVASPLMLMWIYRDNEVGPDHIVTTQLLAKADCVHLTIELHPLTLVDVKAYISDCLRRPALGRSAQSVKLIVEEDNKLQRLSEMILLKTEGSPLFVAQLLKAWNSDGLFKFNFSGGCWDFDLDVVAQSAITSDVVELLQVQMQRFSSATQELLKICACLGNEEISVETLAKSAKRSPSDLSLILHDALEAGFLMNIRRDNPESASIVTKRRNSKVDGTSTKASHHPSLPTVSKHIQFFHDRCQQAAYNLIPAAEKNDLHYKIGQSLIESLSEEEINDNIFELVNHLNHGIGILNTNEERDRLARLNHIAGTKANKATAFEAARNYLQVASDLLGLGGWVGQNTLMGEVTEGLIEVEYSLTDYAAAQEYVRVYLDHSHDKESNLRVYGRAIRCATGVGDALLAIDLGRRALGMVGITLPELGQDAETLSQTVLAEANLNEERILDLKKLPRLVDPIAIGVQGILGALVVPIYFVRIDLIGAIGALALRSAMEFGMGDAGAFCLTIQAVGFSAQSGSKLAEACAYGEVAVAYFEKYGGSPLACPTYKVYASHVAVWARPIREIMPYFNQSVAYGIEYRDAEYIGFGCGELCCYSLLAGAPLNGITSDLERFSVLARKFRNELSTLYIGVIHQIALNLIGCSAHFAELEGEAFSLSDFEVTKDKNYSVTLLAYHMGRLMIAVFSNDRARAKESIAAGQSTLPGGRGLLYPLFFQVFEAVIMFDDYANLTAEDLKKLDDLHSELAQLSQSNPHNFDHLRQWLLAEAARGKGNQKEALERYDEAIAAALSEQAIHLAACMNERCAAMLKVPKLAAGYLLEAHALWTAWGCAPKANLMAAEHPLLFPLPSSGSALHTPVVTPSLAAKSDPMQSFHMQAVLSDGSGGDYRKNFEANASSEVASLRRGDELADGGRFSAWSSTDRNRRKTSSGSHGSHSEHLEDLTSEHRSVVSSEVPVRSHLATELDLRTVVSASSVISMELSVDGVVSKLLALALRTAGAEVCLLVLDKQGKVCAEAIARSDSADVRHLRRTTSIDEQPENFPCSVINYVARSRTMVVNDLDTVGDAISDAYLKKHRPKSILCLALVSQQRSIGVLYMENSQTSNAFTPDRLEILTLISGQAASTIEKARLMQDLKSANADLKRSQAALEGYNRNLEGTVTERTLELRDKNNRLLAEVAKKENAQAEMRSAKDVAEAATQMKSQFLANMSHEIRTPFNAVVALAGLLLDTPLNPVQTDYVETIKNSSQELLVVINDILDYSKIELDHLELSKDKVAIRSILESSLDMVAERAASKSVELALVCKQGDIHIIGDVTRLRQIVVNLLSNAVKFTSNGEITVTASSEPADKDSSRIRISVRDSGIGIAKEHFSKLFRVFSQVEGSTTTKLFGGTGLGLAISRKLSLLMDGDIKVESKLGEGSTFTLEFVAANTEPPARDHYSPSENRDLEGKRCLILDDNMISREVLHQLISSFGLKADAPEDISLAYSMAAEAHAQNTPYSVIIVDAFLPGFAAQVLLRRLRQNGINTPALALTRMGSPIYEEMRQLDCKFLIKPIKRNRLHHTLRQIFPSGEAKKSSNNNGSPNPSPFPSSLAARMQLSILCAEDNPINVKVITHLLKRMGYTADVAEDGQVAVEKAQRKRYDIIFMDVNMPRMNGLEATRKIVEIIPDPAIRPLIVAMTANAMSGDREICIAAGCDGYVSKPILVPDLVDALQQAGAKSNRSDDIHSVPPSASPAMMSSSAFELPLEIPSSRIASRASNRARSGTGSGTSSRSASPPSRTSSEKSEKSPNEIL